jgi:hypothetical protein
VGDEALGGLIRDTLYLLRPDKYVGLGDRSRSVETLQRYLDELECG